MSRQEALGRRWRGPQLGGRLGDLLPLPCPRECFVVHLPKVLNRKCEGSLSRR